MTLRDWAKLSAARVRADGWLGVDESAYELYKGLCRRVGDHVHRGTPLYEADWDLLVVLDGCRVDLMRDVADEYPFVTDVGTFESLGTRSDEWMHANFNPRFAGEMSATIHVTANPNSEANLNADDFLDLDEVWRYAWDDEHGTVRPRAVTDRVIVADRERDPERIVAHYMQPHFPSIPVPIAGGPIELDNFGNVRGVWERIRTGEHTLEEVWHAYRENLRYVLDDVSLLLDNVDADRVVLTADHGNAIGEWGIYGHPDRIPIDPLVEVPWVETTATDTGRYEPTTERRRADAAVDDRLRALGYTAD